MAQLSYPGVYIEEIPSGVHTITGVPTSVAAFVGYTPQGLENKAIGIFSWADFERNFGGLALDSELGYAVQGFYANGGGQAFVVRVPKSDATPALVTINSGATGILALTAISTGAWGNSLAVDIDYDGVAAGDFNLTVTNLSSGVTERFPGLSVSSSAANFAEQLINDPDNGSQLVTAQVLSNIAPPDRNGTLSAALSGVTYPISGNFGLSFSSDIPAVLVTAQDIQIVHATDSVGSAAALAMFIQLRINAALAAVPGAAVVCDVTSAGEIRVRANFNQSILPNTVGANVTLSGPSGGSGLLAISGLTFAPPEPSRYALATGTDGTQLPGNTELIGDPVHQSGMYALRKFDFNLLAIPDATRSRAGQPTVKDTTVDANVIFANAMAFCQDKSAFLLIDTPPDINSVESAVNWRTTGFTVRGNNGAMYFSRLRVADPLNDYKLRTVAPSGIIAGLYARTDSSRGVWKAPAGTDAYLNGVSSPAVILSDAEHGVLNPIGLNCIRAFPVYGHVNWGARTNEGADALASDWKYVPVRRTALFIEQSLYRGTKWAVFEPNDEGLWAQLRLNIGAFMHSLFVQHAFQGTSPRDAYLVKCDRETTTQDDINRGVVNVLVGFAPLKPAEFVVIRIQQMAGQIST